MPDTQESRAVAVEVLADLRDRYTLDEIADAGAILNNSASEALDDGYGAQYGSLLTLAASCIIVVHSILTEQGASQ